LNVDSHLKKLKTIVDKKLAGYLSPNAKGVKLLYEAMRYSVLSSGKRLRPIFAIESAKICGGSLKDTLPAACAIEFIHTYSLIHDDLPSMDDDNYRRGRLTCHKVFGEANAILAGDALLPLAFNIISKETDPAIGLRIIEELSEAVGAGGMAGGQVMDLQYKKRRKNRNILSRINLLKTARLFAASAKCGAITAQVPPKEVRAMEAFGLFFGMSYQIVDDILDGGDYPRVLGKDTARRASEDFIKKADDSLSIFGNRADGLKEIASHILRRES